MRRIDEVQNPQSCLNRAHPEEILFTLLGRDEAAPMAIRAWAAERIRLGRNTADDPHIVGALKDADDMDAERAAIRAKLGKS